MTSREIIITHHEVEDEITPEELEELHELLADMLFEAWRKEKGISL